VPFVFNFNHKVHNAKNKDHEESIRYQLSFFSFKHLSIPSTPQILI